jgi:hypothetical protein
MEAVDLFETLALIYKITRRHISEDGTRALCFCLHTKLCSMLIHSAMVTMDYMLLWYVMAVSSHLHDQNSYPLNMVSFTQ